MATVTPFRALRPHPEVAPEICAPPYDVMSTEEARIMAEGHPLSFLHVSRSEIDFPSGIDPHDKTVYAMAKENFAKLIAEGALRRDSVPAFHLYRQIMGGHTQTGIVGLASCREYQDNIVRKHEFTRPEKEDDRVCHLEALNAQTGQVFLTYRAHADIDAFVERLLKTDPIVDFTAPDEVRHSAWEVRAEEDILFIREAFATMPALYIADGHHRSAAAARVFEARQGADGSDGFLSVLFPHDQMQILAYNRALKDLNGRSPETLLDALAEVFTIFPGAAATPEKKHAFSLYLDGQWYGLHFKSELTKNGAAVDLLDVSLLQDLVLAPLFGIDDPRTSERIAFIGGIRGTGELENRVNSGEFACAFSLFPTRIEDLMAIADDDGIMPPKSTWFEPKLRDGMFCHLLE